jgi:hypothetical protein
MFIVAWTVLCLPGFWLAETEITFKSNSITLFQLTLSSYILAYI